jgi:hypothetical protein
MVDMSSEEAAMPMLQAKPEDDLSNTGGLADGQIKRWFRLLHYSSRGGQLCLAYLIYALCPGKQMATRGIDFLRTYIR